MTPSNSIMKPSNIFYKTSYINRSTNNYLQEFNGTHVPKYIEGVRESQLSNSQ